MKLEPFPAHQTPTTTKTDDENKQKTSHNNQHFYFIFQQLSSAFDYIKIFQHIHEMCISKCQKKVSKTSYCKL
ncbi:CLUMA_CG004099, isoform A [Clunio marinus]|uniref:CLUMA_CG004099, isoform A n=1 Tax=Clunio marinus TaxID=568069 RepID=A0A1J1HQW1_9DIPT|nr:CLUMA_CG004099, isoform A [Clunio marinus]